jgi:TFIIF-interacting CTD phosphatase-like protein
MLVNNMEREEQVYINRRNCRTMLNADDLSECLVDRPYRCPNLLCYQSKKYCVHKDHLAFSVKPEIVH